MAKLFVSSSDEVHHRRGDTASTTTMMIIPRSSLIILYLKLWMIIAVIIIAAAEEAVEDQNIKSAPDGGGGNNGNGEPTQLSSFSLTPGSMMASSPSSLSSSSSSLSLSKMTTTVDRYIVDPNDGGVGDDDGDEYVINTMMEEGLSTKPKGGSQQRQGQRQQLQVHHRILSSSGSHAMNASTAAARQEWNQLDTDEQIVAGIGLLLMFWFCWCVMSCICNFLRAMCYGGGCGGRRSGGYTQIHNYPTHSTVVYHQPRSGGGGAVGGSGGRNCLWAACCFEFCCRDNQDFDCCTLCGPLLCLEVCCPV